MVANIQRHSPRGCCDSRNGSRDPFEWLTFLKSQKVTLIDDFTSLVWCEEVQRVTTRRIRICVFLNADALAGAKANLSFQAFAARLKSCPDTKRRLFAVPKPRD